MAMRNYAQTRADSVFTCLGPVWATITILILWAAQPGLAVGSPLPLSPLVHMDPPSPPPPPPPRPGRKNQPLESFPFANDDRIAKAVPRPDDIFPKGLGHHHHQHQKQHQKQHRVAAHATRARRRSAWEQQQGAGSAGGAGLDAADATAATGGSGTDSPGWRHRAAALRRVFAKRGAEGEGVAIAERFRATAFSGADGAEVSGGSRRLRTYATPRYSAEELAGEDTDVDEDAEDVDVEDVDVDVEDADVEAAAQVFLGSDRHAGGRERAALEVEELGADAEEAEVEAEVEAEGGAGAARTLQAEAVATREDAILTMVRSRPAVSAGTRTVGDWRGSGAA